MTIITDKELRKIAENNVIKVRGSWDAPGFDVCVEAEYQELKQKLKISCNNSTCYCTGACKNDYATKTIRQWNQDNSV